MNAEQEILEQELTLIADFMGEEIVPYPFSGSRENTQHANSPVWILGKADFDGAPRYKNPCDYHRNFKWLMPVVERIETLYDENIEVKIWKNRCEITMATQYAIAYALDFNIELFIYRDEETKMISVFKAVVDFLKWLNQLEELNVWYCEQPFDMVEQITGIDIWNACEDDNERTEALSQARKVWNKMSLADKIEWKRNNS